MNLRGEGKRNATRRFVDGSGLAWEVVMEVDRCEITIRTVGQRRVSRISIADEIRRHDQILLDVPAVVPPEGPPVPVWHCTMDGKRAPGPGPDPETTPAAPGVRDPDPPGPGPAPGEVPEMLEGLRRWARRLAGARLRRRNGGNP